MTKRSPFTIVLGGLSESEAETALGQPCHAGSTSVAAASAFFSSQHETAIALVNAASDQAVQMASRASGGERTPRALALRGHLADELEEHRLDIIQCATAEQARRAANCTRGFFNALLGHMNQPCFVLDDVGTIIQWNTAMAQWTGIPERDALNLPLSSVLCTEAAVEIEAANLLLREAEAQRTEADTDPAFVLDGDFTFRDDITAVRISLLPLCRLPQIVETVVVLVTPGSPLQF